MEADAEPRAEVVAVTIYNDTQIGGSTGVIIYYRHPNSGELRGVDAAGEPTLHNWWVQVASQLSFVPAHWYTKQGYNQEVSARQVLPLGGEPIIADPSGELLQQHDLATHVEFQALSPEILLTPEIEQASWTVTPRGTLPP